MKQIHVVIGDRLGKGQKVAAGVEAASGKATVIPGVAADMKLGDVMKEHNADLGISFCGSGGAGAITAQTKYGYKARYGMRSIEEGETAIAEGCTVLGFGFMDKEELGKRLVKAFNKKHGNT
ncbi:MAG TPA: SFCGS family glycine-rich protein [Arsenophonus sp.]